MQSVNICLFVEGLRCKKAVAKILKIVPLSFGLLQRVMARTVIITRRRPITDE